PIASSITFVLTRSKSLLSSTCPGEWAIRAAITKEKTPMSVDAIIGSWREVRAGLIDEASQIPADKFSFRAADGMRSVAELLQHLVESQKFLVGEACRPDTHLLRKSFAENIKDYAPDVRSVNDKDGILQLL